MAARIACQEELNVRAEPQAGSVGSMPMCELLTIAMGRLRRGMLIVDGDLNILFFNASASAILETGDALVTDQGKLFLHHRNAMGRIERFLSGASCGQTRSSHLTLCLQRRSGDRAYWVWVSPLTVTATTGLPETFLVMIFDPAASRRIDSEVLIDLYGLTRCEAELATRLYNGLTIAEAAVDMKVSANTARTHLRSVFRKCEVESQSQLLQLMSLGPRGD